MSSVKLILTDAQMRKMKSSSPFQLSYKQLSGQSTGKHELTIGLPESDARRLVGNIQKGKGFRFNPKKMEGGATYFQRQARRAKNTLRKIGNTAKDVGKFVAKNIPKDLVKEIANVAIDELDLPPESKRIVDKGIDLGYKSQGKGMEKMEAGGDRLKRRLTQGNPWINHVKRMAQEKGMSYRDALKHPDTKASYQKGGSFFGDLKKGFKKVGKFVKPVMPFAKEIGKDIAKDAVKDAILGAGHGKSKHNIHTEGGQLLHGIPKSMAQRRKARERIHTNGLMHGGSFLPLGE
jgi:hypothetical protein